MIINHLELHTISGMGNNPGKIESGKGNRRGNAPNNFVFELGMPIYDWR